MGAMPAVSVIMPSYQHADYPSANSRIDPDAALT